MRKILENGANPNELSLIYLELLLIIDIITTPYGGPQEHCVQIMELLLEFGANQGKMACRNDYYTNAIIIATISRNVKILEVLLKSDKGRTAVNVNAKYIKNDNSFGNNVLLFSVTHHWFENKSDSTMRKVMVLLIKYGADPYQPQNDGHIAFDWFWRHHGQSEINKQVKKLFDKASNHTKIKAMMNY